MGDWGDGQSNAAVRFCADNYPWLLKKCCSAMAKRGFRNYESDGKDVAQIVCAEFRCVSDEAWFAFENHEAIVIERVRWVADRLYRERHRRPMISLEDMDIPSDRPHRNTLLTALSVREAMNKLPPDRKELVEGFTLQGLTINELAKHFNITPLAVRKRLSRARRDLRVLLSAENAGPP